MNNDFYVMSDCLYVMNLDNYVMMSLFYVIIAFPCFCQRHPSTVSHKKANHSIKND
jgi:hypothetical protein